MEQEHRYTEQQVSHTIIYGKNCMGCQRHKKDIMITFVETEDGKVAHDIFLTETQAREMIVKIEQVIARNHIKSDI